MTIRTLWWFLLVPALGSFLYNLLAHLRYRRRGEPLPEYFVGSVAGGAGFILLIVAELLWGAGTIVWVVLTGSVALTLYAIGRSVHAAKIRQSHR